jgi:hypothetical protein
MHSARYSGSLLHFSKRSIERYHMHTRQHASLFLLLAVAPGVHADQVYKCLKDGATLYQTSPCPLGTDNKVLTLPHHEAPPSPPPNAQVEIMHAPREPTPVPKKQPEMSEAQKKFLRDQAVTNSQECVFARTNYAFNKKQPDGNSIELGKMYKHMQEVCTPKDD